MTKLDVRVLRAKAGCRLGYRMTAYLSYSEHNVVSQMANSEHVIIKYICMYKQY